MTIVFMFPGQSSRYPGMLQKLIELHPPNEDTIAAASNFLGQDLLAHYRKDNDAVFDRNRDIQIGVFLANQMFLQILDAAGIEADLSLGLSLGEYNHLVHIGALDLKEALLTVEQRGLAYDAGPRGAMASIYPIDLEELEPIVQQASDVGVLEIVNLNSPRQHVLSGEAAALDKALEILDQTSYAEARVIEKQIPMHCSIFEPVGKQFRAYLEKVSFQKPKLAYLPNRLGRVQKSPTQQNFVELLSTHVHRPVLWRHSIDWVVEHYPDAVFVEVGPLSVLHNLLNRKWLRNHKLHTDSTNNTSDHLIGVIEDLKQRHVGSQGGELSACGDKKQVGHGNGL